MIPANAWFTDVFELQSVLLLVKPFFCPFQAHWGCKLPTYQLVFFRSEFLKRFRCLLARPLGGPPGQHPTDPPCVDIQWKHREFWGERCFFFFGPVPQKHADQTTLQWLGNTSSKGPFSIAMLDYRSPIWHTNQRIRFINASLGASAVGAITTSKKNVGSCWWSPSILGGSHLGYVVS